jgi:hypothetical protein
MKPILQAVLAFAAALAIALFADAWRSARRDSQQLAATLSSQNAALERAAGFEKQRDSQLAAALAAIQAEKRAVRTPQQAAKQLPSVLPPLPLPISVAGLITPLPPGESATDSTSSGPSTSASISIPQPDLVPLYNALQDCRASALQNTALVKDLADERSRSESLLRERDAALVVARGGTLVVRLKRAAKWFAIGAATGAVFAAAAHR